MDMFLEDAGCVVITLKTNCQLLHHLVRCPLHFLQVCFVSRDRLASVESRKRWEGYDEADQSSEKVLKTSEKMLTVIGF